MKNLFILISLLFCVNLFSQNSISTSYNTLLDYDETFVWYNGATADSIGSGDSIYTYTVYKKTDARLYPYIALKLDSARGTGDTVNVFLKHKVGDQESFANLDTAVWRGQAASSGDTLTFDYNTATKGGFYQIYVIGEGDSFKATLDWLEIKFVK